MDLNSTFDRTLQSNSDGIITMYGEVITNPNILPYQPKKFDQFEKTYKIVQQVYDNPLAATKIYLAQDSNEMPFAIKEIRKEKLKDKFGIELARNEMTTHYTLSKMSNYICSVPEYFENEQSYYMIMEYCSNPNYFQYRLENKLKQFDNESILKHYTLNVLYGLAEIHKNNVIHCDLKPDNFLLFSSDPLDLNTSNDDDSNMSGELDELQIVKLTDFGLAHIISQDNSKTFMKYHCGSFGYSAPEKKSESYIDKSVDMWSFGVCLYQMAVAYKPTATRNYKYGTGPIPFLQSHWKKFDFANLKNLIESCLLINPKERITAEEAINHPWFDG